MSFARVGRSQQQTKGRRPGRPKKAIAPRKDWVDTVSDLSVHKLTPAELNHRHEIHKSHNKAAAQWELKERALKRRLRHTGSPEPLDQASLSIIREIFSDQMLLQDVLARSDRAMAVVKDLFGDAPRRQTGHPSVTVAPNCDSDSELPVLQKPDPPTQLSLLSQSMMDQEALNEVDVSKENRRGEGSYRSCSSESHVTRRSSVRKMKAQSQNGVMQQQKVHRLKYHEEVDVPVTPCTSGRAPDQSALNATVAVRRVRSKQNQSQEGKEENSDLVSQVLNPDLPSNQSGRTSRRTNRTRKCVSQSSELDGSSLVASLSGDQSTLGVLQSMLGQVEADLDALSSDRVPESAGSPKRLETQGLTGFSVALVSALRRLVQLLKQREAEAQKEAEDRRKLQEELKGQQELIDALTAETMTLREEAASLQAAFQQRTAELEQKLDSVVLVMGGLGQLGQHTSPPKHSQHRDSKCNVSQSVPVAEKAPEKTHVCVRPAVLLSPPRQSENWQQSLATRPAPLQHHVPPADSQNSCEVVQAHSSVSSLHSVPLSRLSSSSSLSLPSDALRSQASPEAMLAEIVQLSRQNELMRAQLDQAKGFASGVAGLPNSSNQRGEQSPVSTGRITPQDVGERRMSGSSSTSRGQNTQSPEDETLSQLATSSNTLSVSSVERRLLELNRQSTAARTRLLELIELQKQNVSVRGSPSVSPVPPSAFSPQTAAGGQSPEELRMLPERDAHTHRRSGGSDVSSQSFESGTRKIQTVKQREQEGWFALSAHVR